MSEHKVLVKKYDYIVPLGRNCEVGIQLKRCFNFVEAFPFNWAFIRNYDKFLNFLQNDGLIFSEQVQHNKNNNMIFDEFSSLDFHGRRTSAFFKEIADDKQYEVERKKEIDELKSRISYLLDKLHRIQQSGSKILYVLTIPTAHNEKLFFDTPECVKEFALQVEAILSRTTKQFDLLVIIATYDNYFSTNISDNIYIRSLRFFSPITRVSAIECSDFVGWNHIFEEFQPSHIKEENKKYKFSTNFSTIFFKQGYLLMYKDVAKDPLYSRDPFKHYNEIGKFEGRDNGLNPPTEIFDAKSYKKSYEEKMKRTLQINPWVHYVLFDVPNSTC